MCKKREFDLIPEYKKVLKKPRKCSINPDLV